MRDLGQTTGVQSRIAGVLLAVGLAGLLAGMVGMGLLAAAAWPSGWGSDHMGRMMGSGRDSSGDPARQGSLVESVDIEDYAYSPGNLRVPVGASVTWTNLDSASHSATDLNGAWDTGLLAQGELVTLVFDTPGTFQYFCTLHPAMKSRLVVG